MYAWKLSCAARFGESIALAPPHAGEQSEDIDTGAVLANAVSDVCSGDPWTVI